MDLQMPLISFDETKSKLIKVDVAALPPNEELISPAPAREFVQDIYIRGQLQPIHLSKVSKGSYFVISGRRRIKAFRELQKMEPDNGKWKVMEALVVDAKDEASILAASASNNRRSDNVLTDLQALDYLLAKNPSISIPDMAKFSGMSQGTVKSRLRLKKLDPILLQALIDGHMTAQTAEKAAVLPSEFQGKLIVQFLKEGKLALEDVAESQRTRVQQTVDNQLTIPELNMVLTPEEQAISVRNDPTMSILLGYAPFFKEQMVITNEIKATRAEAQTDLEAWQGQVSDPTQYVLVAIYQV